MSNHYRFGKMGFALLRSKSIRLTLNIFNFGFWNWVIDSMSVSDFRPRLTCRISDESRMGVLPRLIGDVRRLVVSKPPHRVQLKGRGYSNEVNYGNELCVIIANRILSLFDCIQIEKSCSNFVSVPAEPRRLFSHREKTFLSKYVLFWKYTKYREMKLWAIWHFSHFD